MKDDMLQPLRAALAEGNKEAIQAALPEPPQFLPAVFRLPVNERNALLGSILPILETEEDQWEVIEAAAQDTNARPDNSSLLALVPLIPPSLVSDTRKLASSLKDPAVASTVIKAIDERAAELGIALSA